MALSVHTILEPAGPAAAIELTDEQVETLGGGKRAPVRVTIADRSVRLRLAVMGGRNLIGLSKAARSDLGVAIGDTVDAVIELDGQERTVEIPDDLASALAGVGVRSAFEALTYSRRKELVSAITGAKRDETRRRRVHAAVDAVAKGD